MHKRNIWIVLMCIFALTLVGCGNKKIADTETNKIKTSEEDVDEPNKEDDTEQENSGTSDDTTEQENESIDNASDTGNNSNTTTGNTITKPSTENNNTTTKPSTGSDGNSGSANSGSTNNSGSNGNTQNNNGGTTTQPSTPVHEHKWTEVTEYEIHYYAWRTICGKCKTDLTDMTDDELTWHTVAECHSGYSTHYIEVDFVTENVVKTPVVTGYKCECGATKK